jgi:signal transduction histidine kinase
MLAKKLQYTFNPCGARLTVRAEAAKVRQIVLNLLANATKFTEVGGSITVECHEGSRGADAAAGGALTMHTVSVTDTGIGIPADQIGKIFEPFVQVNRRHTSSDVGVGLGLAISRDLAQGMGGDLTVKSTPGVGSTFTLSLPAS